MLSPLTLGIRFFHISDYGLPTVIYMDVLDPDKLLAAVTQASKNLNLYRIRLEQTSRCRRERHNSLFGS